MENNWISVAVCLPDNNELVDTKIDDKDGKRNEHRLSRNGRLWFADGVYVYYTPTHWRKINTKEVSNGK